MKNAVGLSDVVHLRTNDLWDLDRAYNRYVSGLLRDSGRQGVYHPSAISMCGRMNVYEFIFAPQVPTIPAETLEIFELGHHVHDMVQGRIEGLANLSVAPFKIDFVREARCPPDDELLRLYGVGGTADGLLQVTTPEWTQRSTLEVKSINTDDFQKLLAPYRAHEWQAHLYAYRFNTPIIYYLYFNKNNSKRKVYGRLFDWDRFDEAVAFYVTWNAHVANGTLPEREESWLDCKSCAYRVHCQPEILKSREAKAASRLSANRKKGLRRLTVV